MRLERLMASRERAFDRRAPAAARPGSVLLETTRSRPGACSYCFTNPLEWVEARTLDEVPQLFARLAAARAQGLWAAGYIGYECGYHWEPTAAPGFVPAPGRLPLAAFGIYRQPVVFLSTPSDAGALPGVGLGLDHVALEITPDAFASKIAAIREWIEAGDTYQVNLTDQVEADYSGSAAELFTHMMTTQPVEFGALLSLPDAGPGGCHILSASPELFFELRDREITVRPMKGTSPRGCDTFEDTALALALSRDPKNRAENIMIVDLLRSDLGRIAQTGSVRVQKLFEVEQFPSLLQMSSEITARLRPEIDMYTLFRSLFPSGSIVGAPKVRTMQLLQALEGRERGVYTGAIGYFAPNGDATFSVAIRTAVLANGKLTMGVGAGITYDSDAQAEYEECLLKTAFLREPPFELIETMRCETSVCALLPLHMARLGASAAHFGFRMCVADVEAAVQTAVAKLPCECAFKLRLTLHADGNITLGKPERIEADAAPLQAMLWPTPVRSTDEFLQHKTTRRALYDTAIRKAREQGYVDALFVNEHDMVTEGAIHNIVVRHGMHWRTPPLTAGVLPGVYRAHLLQTMPGLVEDNLTPEQLRGADEIWLTNAVRGMRRVSLVESEPLHSLHTPVRS